MLTCLLSGWDAICANDQFNCKITLAFKWDQHSFIWVKRKGWQHQRRTKVEGSLQPTFSYAQAVGNLVLLADVHGCVPWSSAKGPDVVCPCNSECACAFPRALPKGPSCPAHKHASVTLAHPDCAHMRTLLLEHWATWVSSDAWLSANRTKVPIAQPCKSDAG